MRRVLASALIAGVAVAAPVAAVGAGSDNPSSAPVDTAPFEGLAIDKTRLQDEARDRARAAQRRARADQRRESSAAPVAVPAVLKQIAACESGGNPRAIGGGGLYRGLLQFDRQTWASVGGTGDPAAASPAEQYRRGAILYARAGTSPWPVCG